jgi:dienelactone hydrolase
MPILKTILIICLLILMPGASSMAGELKTYNDGNTILEGYYAPSTCDKPSPNPTVIIIHQWMGLGDYEKRRADMLASDCFNAFAIDMYGKDKRPANKEEAAGFSGVFKSDPDFARQRLTAALEFVKTLEAVDPNRIAAIGYCFGGTMALELARSGAEIKGAVSFHGGLSTNKPAVPGEVKASIQVHHGAADPHVPQEQVLEFMMEMDSALVDWHLTQYAGAVHAFTEKEAGNDPSTGAAYNEKADIRSWSATMDFLNEQLAPNDLDKSDENKP